MTISPTTTPFGNQGVGTTSTDQLTTLSPSDLGRLLLLLALAGFGAAFARRRLQR